MVGLSSPILRQSLIETPWNCAAHGKAEASHSDDDKSNFVVPDADVVDVTMVGMVFNIVERNSYVTFTIDDGFGKLECKKWLNEPFDKYQIEEISEAIYVHVDGHLRSFKGDRHADIFSVRPVTNFDEITFHFRESVRTLEDEGMIYSTIDEFHYKATSSS